MKNIAVLGSTGSVGQNSLQVIANFPERYNVTCLAVNKNVEHLKKQIAQFKPKSVAVLDREAASRLQKTVNGDIRVYAGHDGLLELIAGEELDVVISSFVGVAGLEPTLAAVERGTTVALANKETLVVAGEILMRKAHERGARIIPVDSEHSAIVQCLLGEPRESVAKLILTASGGPFLHVDKKDFDTITVERALNHPTWKMGDKITIDSATLMNKGLEVIEAHWLFGLPADKIEVVIHPQSIIHSMVEFVDGSVKAQMGVPDMKIPIQYALTYPQRLPSSCARIDFTSLKEMTFLRPDLDKFECLALAYRALRDGGTAAAVMNAANEVAVELFLSRRIPFSNIPRMIGKTMDHFPVVRSPDLDTILEADRSARTFVRSLIN